MDDFGRFWLLTGLDYWLLDNRHDPFVLGRLTAAVTAWHLTPGPFRDLNWFELVQFTRQGRSDPLHDRRSFDRLSHFGVRLMLLLLTWLRLLFDHRRVVDRNECGDLGQRILKVERLFDDRLAGGCCILDASSRIGRVGSRRLMSSGSVGDLT